MIITAAAGVIVGVPALRMTGVYLTIATLAFALIIQEVFARWAAPEPTPGELPELEDALVASVLAARAEPERLAYESADRYGYPAGFLARYFEKLRYRFGPRERAGLLTFFELAADVGALEKVPELRFLVSEAVEA